MVAEHVYLFAGGGTGGHLFPGIAVAEELLRRRPDARILFAGTDRPIEQSILSSTPFEHVPLPAISLAEAKRRPLRFLRSLWSSRREAGKLISRERPAAVIGCGGLASAAPVYAARRGGVPFLLLEQNLIPGRATRWLSRLGGTVCLSFAESSEHLHRSAQAIVTGNPVRQAVAELAAQETPLDGDPGQTLLILGGSQGARAINDLLIEFVARCPDTLSGWRLVHQTGRSDVDRVREHYASAGIDAEVCEFFKDISACYRAASLVVSRAGATTLAELACAGRPALLVPYPYAFDNHQWHNADRFERAGAAVNTRQGMDSQHFCDCLASLLTDPSRRRAMATAMTRLARPDAATQVVEALPVPQGT